MDVLGIVPGGRLGVPAGTRVADGDDALVDVIVVGVIEQQPASPDALYGR
jgi:hypothetical protein